VKTGRYGAIEKRSSAVLRCKQHRSTYVYIRLAILFFARLASEHFFIKILPYPPLQKEGMKTLIRLCRNPVDNETAMDKKFH